MSKDTIATLKNLKKDIESISMIPDWVDYETMKYLRLRVLAEIDKTIERKS